MEFSGEFELKGLATEEAWLVLTDPVALRRAIPGCQFLVSVEDEDVDVDALEPDSSDDETIWPEADRETIEARQIRTDQHLASVMKVGIGPMKPSFKVMVEVERADFPEVKATGRGTGGGSEFQMESGMSLSEGETGAVVSWRASTNISGKLAQMGQRMLKPVANKLTKQFFTSIENQVQPEE